jgi:hypothetical protein
MKFYVIIVAIFVFSPLEVGAQGFIGADPISESFSIAQQIGGGALGTADPRDIMVSLVNTLLSFFGLYVIVIILWGGFSWMISGGNEERLATARSTLSGGVIGAGLIFSSFAITRFLLTSFSDATGGTVTF